MLSSLYVPSLLANETFPLCLHCLSPQFSSGDKFCYVHLTLFHPPHSQFSITELRMGAPWEGNTLSSIFFLLPLDISELKGQQWGISHVSAVALEDIYPSLGIISWAQEYCCPQVDFITGQIVLSDPGRGIGPAASLQEQCCLGRVLPSVRRIISRHSPGPTLGCEQQLTTATIFCAQSTEDLVEHRRQ